MLSINIEHGFSHYSSEELLDKAHQGSPEGSMFCGETDISSLIDKLFDDVHAVAYEEGFEAGKRVSNEFCWVCGEEV